MRMGWCQLVSIEEIITNPLYGVVGYIIKMDEVILFVDTYNVYQRYIPYEIDGKKIIIAKSL